MFLLTKFAFVTCAVYIGISILIDAAISFVARGKIVSFFVGKGSVLPGGLVFFGAIWLVADRDHPSTSSVACLNAFMMKDF